MRQKIETHVFEYETFVVSVRSPETPMPRDVASSIAADILGRLRPGEPRKQISICVEDPELGYAFEVEGIFPSEVTELKRVGHLDGNIRDLREAVSLPLEVHVCECPVPPSAVEGESAAAGCGAN